MGETTGKERPILFSGPMIRALLAGTKRQTRRLITPQPTVGATGSLCWKGRSHGQHLDGTPATPVLGMFCPYGQPGDRLWVRETWAPHADETRQYRADRPASAAIYYAADNGMRAPEEHGRVRVVEHPHINGWRPSIHMPRWASRITLEVTAVRVQRLQEISEEDAKAEGVERSNDACWLWRNYSPLDGAPFVRASTSFLSLWESINGKRASWASNSWVWAISFEVRP